MSGYDITDGMSDWDYALYNERKRKENRLNRLIQKYGFPVREENLLEEDFVEYDLLKNDLEQMQKKDVASTSQTHGTSLDDEDMAKNAEKVREERSLEQDG